MRAFSAIPLPESVKSQVADITRNRLPVSYVNTDSLHVTLNFFGELDTDKFEKLKKIFTQAVGERQKINIEFDKVMKFHHQLHMTLKPNKALEELHGSMQKFFLKENFDLQTRTYYPHVTLTSLHMDKVMHRERKIELFPNQELAKLNFQANKVVLYESKLLLHHAHHSPMVEVGLK